MPNTRALIITSILIISLAFISATVSNNLTGKASYTYGTNYAGSIHGNTQQTTISINPNIVRPGQTVEVTITPGAVGTYKIIKVCKPNGLCTDRTSSWCKESFKCMNPVTFDYVIPSELKPGVYSMQAYDYVIADYVSKDFEVQNYSSGTQPLQRILTNPIPPSWLNSFINNQ